VDAKALEPVAYWPPPWITWREEGLVLPERWRTVIKDSRTKLTVDITASIRGGRLLCEQLCLSSGSNGAPITTAGLRNVAVAALLEQAAKSVAQVQESPDDDWEDEGTVAASRADARLRQLASGGRTKDDRSTVLRKVVATYRKAVKANHPAPREYVASQLDYSVKYVGKLLVEARKQGVMRPALAGRPGEEPLPKRTRSKKAIAKSS
jgi:hypothetical protein